ncbi:MAG: ABC transporter ATP-binding protein [Candidatus Tectomicrobia bacterium]|nr:ABC transporter ATP-binding protein [Candidatus Tectomicrobia bacterium]
MLRVENVSAVYGDLQALRNVSLEVNEREMVALIGANGAGKTTLLRLISRLLRPVSGSIRFLDTPIERLKPHRIVERGISHIPEGRQLFVNMTVLENLEIGAKGERARNVKEESLNQVFELFPRLKERRRQLAGTLSGGEQQMLAIGRGLMASPKLLMLDEPSLGLSPLMVATIFEALKAINSHGTTILLVEQNVYQALKLCQRGYVLENGEITLEDKGEELLKNPHVREAYLGM